MSSRAPYIVAGLIALAPLVALSSAAPGGNDWRWGEFPTHVTVIALVLCLVAANRRGIQLALLTPLLVAVLAFVWGVIGEYFALRKFHATHLLGKELGLLFDTRFVHLAPWLVGGLYGAIAALAVRRSRDLRKNIVRAGAWLFAVGAFAAGLTLANRSWLTLESTESHVIRSSVAWPDSKVLAIVLAAITMAAGAAAIVAATLRKRSALPVARVVR